jgi:hypothetical protein
MRSEPHRCIQIRIPNGHFQLNILLRSDYLYGTDDDCPLPSFHARAKKFTEWGAVCTGIEYEGHGRHVMSLLRPGLPNPAWQHSFCTCHRSEGVPGYTYSWDAIADDVEQYVNERVLPQWPGLPLFVMGESMGGASRAS